MNNLLYKILPTRLGMCKPTFHAFYISPQDWGRVNQLFILFIHHIWGETVPWGAVFIIQTSDRMQYFTILQYKLHSFNIHDLSKHAWAFTETVNKNFKITYKVSQFSLLTSAKVDCLNQDNRVIRFNIINSLLCLFFI